MLNASLSELSKCWLLKLVREVIRNTSPGPVSIETPVKKASHTFLSIHKGPWGKCGGFTEDTMVPQFPHVWQSWDLNSGRQAPELRFALASVSRSKEIVSGKTGDSPSLSMPWHDL